jgi:uncharacterized OB-fold protein
MSLQWVGEVGSDKFPHIARMDEDSVTLVGGLCAHCGTVAFPLYGTCINCGGSDVRSTTLPQMGQLYTWTRVHVSNSRSVPYWLGYVDFPGDTRVLGELRLGSIDAHAGLEVSVRSDATGQWWFEPVRSGA